MQVKPEMFVQYINGLENGSCAGYREKVLLQYDGLGLRKMTLHRHRSARLAYRRRNKEKKNKKKKNR